MYSTNLMRALQNRINDATTSEEVFKLSEIIRKINVGNVKVVSTYVNLLNIFVADGSLYFVEDEEALYYGINGIWNKVTETFSVSISSWGSNAGGPLGDGTTVAKSSPNPIIAGGFSDWIEVSAGSAHSLGIRDNGSIWSWGLNTNGELGDNTVAAKSTPVTVVGGIIDWTQVNAGNNHSLALRANGTAWAWGLNTFGRLGDGTTAARSSPVAVVGGFVDWVQLSAGSGHSSGIRANGTAWAWGNNLNGQLGDGTTASKSSPVAVVGGFADWVQINAGNDHSLALRSNGTIWAWGSAGQGRLGDATTLDKSSPVAVVGGFTDWVELGVGVGQHNMAIRSNGTAWAWGSNFYGQLGDGSVTTASKSSPVAVVGGFTNWIRLSIGTNHSLGLRANGTAWAWGNNYSGRLGDGTTVSKSSPVAVVGGFSNWIQLSAGGQHSVALRNN